MKEEPPHLSTLKPFPREEIAEAAFCAVVGGTFCFFLFEFILGRRGLVASYYYFQETI